MKITKRVLLDVEQERIRQMTQQTENEALERLILCLSEDWIESVYADDVYNNLIKIAATTVKMAEVYKRGLGHEQVPQ